MSKPVVRLIAHYLPQFHPIPENDEWWGRGFTEWRLVAQAKPLFSGHAQPRLPGELGFYDLRIPEVRAAQAELAREHGIEGFCYWHYWFAGGRLLERPFNEVLESGEPDFPFCLAWANHTWSRVWEGKSRVILMEQTYPGVEDYTNHFHSLLPAFSDPRYITVDGKPLFVVFRPQDLPEPREFADCWHALAEKSGLKGIYIMGITCSPWNLSAWTTRDCGFDASLTTACLSAGVPSGKPERNGPGRMLREVRRNVRLKLRRPVVRRYDTEVMGAFSPGPLPDDCYPAVLSNWDNTPRHKYNRGRVLVGSNPEAFRAHLRDGISQVIHRDDEHRIVFIKSWNEWAEGNYIEPDAHFGRGYLEAIRDEVLNGWRV